MSQVRASDRTGITVRLPAETRDRVQRIAAMEHRSVAGYVEMLIERDLHARDESERVISVFVAPELADEPVGDFDREPGESDARYAERNETLQALLGARRPPRR